MDSILAYTGKITRCVKRKDRQYFCIWIGNKEKLKPLLGKKVLVIILPVED